MKKQITLLLFLISNIYANAQNCKPDGQVTDKYTKNSYVWYNFKLKASGGFFKDIDYFATLQLALVNEKYPVVWLSFARIQDDKGNLPPIKILKGNTITFANASTSIKLIALADAKSSTKDIFSGQSTHQKLSVAYEIKRSDLKIFTENSFDGVLIDLDGSPSQEAKISKVDGESIKTVSNCIFDKLPKEILFELDSSPKEELPKEVANEFNEKSIIGNWKTESSLFVTKKDGSILIRFNSGNVVSGTWKAEKNKFIVVINNQESLNDIIIFTKDKFVYKNNLDGKTYTAERL